MIETLWFVLGFQQQTDISNEGDIIVFNILTKLFNIFSFLFDNPTETRNNLITRGTHSFKVNFCPTFLQFFLRAITLVWVTLQAFCSKIDHVPKSIGFKSVEQGGQSSLCQKDSKLSLHQFWTNLAV